MSKPETAIVEKRSSLPKIQNILTGVVLIGLFWALFTGATYKFYASFLFLFYSVVGKMWISVIGLGLFQTLLMIPFRIVNLSLSMRVKKFKKKIENIEKRKSQMSVLRQNIKKGNAAVLWYMINFAVQSITYLSIGRLFLTDFYNSKLDLALLYNFVSYPKYPIKGLYFKLPYPVFLETVDFGMKPVIVVWVLAVVFKIVVSRFFAYVKKNKEKFEKGDDKSEVQFSFVFVKNAMRYISGSILFVMLVGWLLLRNFPVNWEFRIFSRSVSVPSPTLNLITALMTFFIILWQNIPKIAKRVRMARKRNVEEKTIKEIRSDQLRNTFKNATVLGVGAYFLTNLIPCAFELSIFTLEIMSLLSPFTIDRIIYKNIGD